MPTVFFYLFACIPLVIGGLLWALDKRIVLAEWIGGAALGFIMAGSFHWMAVAGATADTETWSGHIIRAVHYPEWVEEYYVTHFTYDDKGNVTGTYTTTEYTTHHEHWTAYSNINTEYDISPAMYENMVSVFGNHNTEKPYKGGFYSGDPNVYPTINHNRGEYFPITDKRSWTNKVRATPTTFSFAQVPPGTKVFPYPANRDPFRSDRLLGSAVLINTLEFDRLNARLGPSKKVNLILVGFGDSDSMMAQWQEAAWIGGKKNDICITYGGLNSKPTWVRAFGWTDSKTCLRTIESTLLEKGVTLESLTEVEQEIRDGYTLKDWEKSFGHINVPAPMWAVWWYLAVTITGQAIFWYWAHRNDLSKPATRTFPDSYRRYI